MQANNTESPARIPGDRRILVPFLRIGWIAAAMLLFFGMLSANAQYSANLQGTVADSQGAMIPGATLVLTDKETNHTLTATSDQAGNFTFNELPPNTFSLVATRDGFKKKILDNIKILAEQPNALNVVMDIGGTSETVTVNAGDLATIDTATGSIGGTITQNDLAKMPDFGRDPLSLVQLAPGMFGDSAQGAGGGGVNMPGNENNGQAGASSSSGPYITENHPQVIANGGRNDTNGITIDGVQVTSVTWGSSAVVTPNPDTIKEMKVVANPYDASLGRFSGAQIQIISQNGTNQFHGTALYKLDRPGLNAYQRFNNSGKQRDNAKYNEFGGTVGGPIIHNRVFAFFGYDTIRNNGTELGAAGTTQQASTANRLPARMLISSSPSKASRFRTSPFLRILRTITIALA